MSYEVEASCRERVRCATGLLTLGAGGDACGFGSAFGGVAKFEGGTADGLDSTFGGGAVIVSGTNLGGGFYFGGGKGDATGSAAGGVIMVLVSSC